jgi:hypothetical protein
VSRLDSKPVVDKFMQDIKRVESNWQNLKPNQRTAELSTVINQTLNFAGLPNAEVAKSSQLPQGTRATFDAREWAITINQDLINDPDLFEAKPNGQDSDALELAKTVYHEMRHSEQHYRIAQWLVSKSVSPQEITNATGMPVGKMQAAEKGLREHPLTNEQNKQAEAWCQSIYGKNSAHRTEVFRALDSTEDAFSAAKRAYGRALNEHAEHKRSYESQVRDYSEKSKVYQSAVAKLEIQLKSGQDQQLSPSEASKYLRQLAQLDHVKSELTKYSSQLDTAKQNLDKEANNIQYKLEPAYEKARAAADRAYSQYTSLPEEADAFKIQVPVQAVYESKGPHKSEERTSIPQVDRGLPKDSTTPMRSVPAAPAQAHQTVAHAAQLSSQELKNLSPVQLLSAANAVQKWQKSEPRLDHPEGSPQLSRELGSLVQKQANLAEQHQYNTKNLKEVQQQGVRSLFNPFGASMEKNNEAHASYHTTRGNLERVEKAIVQVKSNLQEARAQETAHQKWSENPQHKTFETLAQKLKQPEIEAKVDKLQAGMSYLRQWEYVAKTTGQPWGYITQIHDIREDYLQGKPIPQEVTQEMKQQLGQYKVQKELEAAAR